MSRTRTHEKLCNHWRQQKPCCKDNVVFKISPLPPLYQQYKVWGYCSEPWLTSPGSYIPKLMSICWYTTSAFRSLPSSIISNKFLILTGMQSCSASTSPSDRSQERFFFLGLGCFISAAQAFLGEHRSGSSQDLILCWQCPSINLSSYCLLSSILARRACDDNLSVIFCSPSLTNFCFHSLHLCPERYPSEPAFTMLCEVWHDT